MQVLGDVQATYRKFAVYAAGNSACFEQWALAVAEDAEVQHWLAGLPKAKRQPNLVFAAARWHGLIAAAPYEALRSALLRDDGRIRETILERATRTKRGRPDRHARPGVREPGGPIAPSGCSRSAQARGCACSPTVGPIAATPTRAGRPTAPGPTLAADTSGPAPLPDQLPEVAWRGGIDLNPLDVTDPDTSRWLLTLVWPGHDDRRERLEQALEIARRDPPVIRRGDLLQELPGLVAEALAGIPRDGVLVVFHSAASTANSSAWPSARSPRGRRPPDR